MENYTSTAAGGGGSCGPSNYDTPFEETEQQSPSDEDGVAEAEAEETRHHYAAIEACCYFVEHEEREEEPLVSSCRGLVYEEEEAALGMNVRGKGSISSMEELRFFGGYNSPDLSYGRYASPREKRTNRTTPKRKEKKDKEMTTKHRYSAHSPSYADSRTAASSSSASSSSDDDDSFFSFCGEEDKEKKERLLSPTTKTQRSRRTKRSKSDLAKLERLFDKSSPHWNELLQNALDHHLASAPIQKDDESSTTISRMERLSRALRLDVVQRRFEDCVRQYVRVIVEETLHDTPPEKRIIPPLSSQLGIAGGLKFLWKNVFIKFSKDEHGIYGGDEFSSKATALELNHLRSILLQHVPNINVPLMTVLDYFGFRLICLSLLPVSDETLVYGSADGGINIIGGRDPNGRVRGDGVVCTKIEELARKLNLKPHSCGQGGSRAILCLPADVECHVGFDGRIYCLDLARLMPPEYPQSRIPVVLLKADSNTGILECAIRKRDWEKELAKLLLVGSPDELHAIEWNGVKCFHINGRTAHKHDMMLNSRATAMLGTTIHGDVIFIKGTRGHLFYNLLRPNHVASNPHPLSPDACSGFESNSSQKEGNIAEVRAATHRLQFQVLPTLVEDIAKGLVLVDNEAQLSPLLHQQGVNMRYLGLLLALLLSKEKESRSNPAVAAASSIVLTEMISRVAKNELREILRSVDLKKGMEKAQQAIVSYFNMILGEEGSRSEVWWKTQVKVQAMLKYGYYGFSFTPDITAAHFDLRQKISKLHLFQSLQRNTGVKFNLDTQLRSIIHVDFFENDNGYRAPFTINDFEEVQVRSYRIQTDEDLIEHIKAVTEEYQSNSKEEKRKQERRTQEKIAFLLQRILHSRTIGREEDHKAEQEECNIDVMLKDFMQNEEEQWEVNNKEKSLTLKRDDASLCCELAATYISLVRIYDATFNSASTGDNEDKVTMVERMNHFVEAIWLLLNALGENCPIELLVEAHYVAGLTRFRENNLDKAREHFWLALKGMELRGGGELLTTANPGHPFVLLLCNHLLALSLANGDLAFVSPSQLQEQQSSSQEEGEDKPTTLQVMNEEQAACLLRYSEIFFHVWHRFPFPGDAAHRCDVFGHELPLPFLLLLHHPMIQLQRNEIKLTDAVSPLDKQLLKAWKQSTHLSYQHACSTLKLPTSVLSADDAGSFEFKLKTNGSDEFSSPSTRRRKLTLYAWGCSHYGQCGMLHVTTASIPQAVDTLQAPTLPLRHIKQLCCSSRGSYALTEMGEVFKWGEGIAQPTNLELQNIIQMDCGSEHCIALNNEGEVFTWGSSENGRLGHCFAPSSSNNNSSSTFIDTPTKVGALSGIPVVAVAAGGMRHGPGRHSIYGGGHSLALSADGNVYGWGYAARVGTAPPQDTDVPQLITALENKEVVSICCGGSHSLALTRSGLVYSWGTDNLGRARMGQLGFGNGEAAKEPTLVEALAGKKVAKVAAGIWSSYAITEDGEVFGWGSKEDLGLGPLRGPCFRPRLLTSLLGKPIERILCGDHFAVALLKDGKLLSWGENFNGQIGKGTIDARQPLPFLIAALYSKRVLHMACGERHCICIAESEEELEECNAISATNMSEKEKEQEPNGELGEVEEQGTSTDHQYRQRAEMEQRYLARGVNMYASTSYAVSTVQVYDENPLQDTATEEEEEAEENPKPRSNSRKGQVYGWGYNSNGECGTGDVETCLSPTLIQSLCHVHVNKIVTNMCSVFALSDEGELWVWGGNEAALAGLGFADSCSRGTPRQLRFWSDPTSSSPLPIRDVAAGTCTVFVRTGDGKVYSWGRAADGSLHKEPVLLKQLSEVASISFMTCADSLGVFVIEGRVYILGSLNMWPQTRFLQPTEVQSMAHKTVISVYVVGRVASMGTASAGHLLVLTADGEVWMVNENLQASQVQELAGRKTVQIVAAFDSNYSFALALQENGKVFSWGSNAKGQLGIYRSESEQQQQAPHSAAFVEVVTLANKGIIFIACGTSHAVALSETGAVYTWGNGGEGLVGRGALGHGQVQNEWQPRLVEALRHTFIRSVAASANHTFAVTAPSAFVTRLCSLQD
ncbi:hypothetical protein QOT17_006386 [Balamuthia mandrillaris]